MESLIQSLLLEKLNDKYWETVKSMVDKIKRNSKIDKMETDYTDLLYECAYSEGILEPNRTGVSAYTCPTTKILKGTVKKLGDNMYQLPIIQGKKIHLKSVLHELLWFISGDTNANTLKYKGVNIWNDWADEYGELGPIYGKQWRKWRDWEVGTYYDEQVVDQLKTSIESIISTPNSRRHIVNSWNVHEVPTMALPPCHLLYQFTVVNNKLSIKVYMRSTDVFLGLPFNLTSYALLLIMVSRLVGIEPANVEIIMAMPHVYENHIEACITYFEQVKEMYEVKDFRFPLVEITDGHKTIDDFKYEDFTFRYDCMPVIKAPIAV